MIYGELKETERSEINRSIGTFILFSQSTMNESDAPQKTLSAIIEAANIALNQFNRIK